jgi:hypothetical protein
MNESEFWSLIGAAKADSQGNLDRQVEVLLRTLERHFVLPPKKWTQVRQLFLYPKCCSNSTGDW